MNNYRAKKILQKVMFICLIFTIILVLLFPVAAMISVSLKEANDVFSIPVTWIPKTFAFENYIEVFKKMHIINGFKASLAITAMTILLIMIIGIPAAYALSCLNFYGKKQIYYITLVS